MICIFFRVRAIELATAAERDDEDVILNHYKGLRTVPIFVWRMMSIYHHKCVML